MLSSTMGNNDLLVVISQLSGTITKNNKIHLTEKFVEGIESYVDYWQGPVKALVNPVSDPDGHLDRKEYSLADLRFDVSLVDFDNLAGIQDEISQAAVVQGGSSHQLNGLAQYCVDNQIAYIHCSEYSFKTRCQIVDANTRNPVLRFRRYLWEWNQERANRKEVALSAASQCNGTPVYEAYRSINDRAILYFDNRITDDLLLEPSALKPIPGNFDQQRPIRLAFSGRLNKMKGGDALIRIAAILQQRNLPFELHIYGGGELERDMEMEIKNQRLSNQVIMYGVLDFSTELMPELKERIDLFVCCHVQGDPSCTYIETFACGVPIVGYRNEAFDGILRIAEVGWGVPIFDDEGVANLIESAVANPELLDPVRRNALNFATKNTFHKTFDTRIQQMKGVQLK